MVWDVVENKYYEGVKTSSEMSQEAEFGHINNVTLYNFDHFAPPIRKRYFCLNIWLSKK